MDLPTSPAVVTHMNGKGLLIAIMRSRRQRCALFAVLLLFALLQFGMFSDEHLTLQPTPRPSTAQPPTQEPATSTPEPATSEPPTPEPPTQEPPTPEPSTSEPPTPEPSTSVPPTPQPSTAKPGKLKVKPPLSPKLTPTPPPPWKPAYRLGILTVNYPHTDRWWEQATSDITNNFKARYAAEYHEHVDFISVNTAVGDFPTDGASTDIGTPLGLRPLYNHSLFNSSDPAMTDPGASWEWLAKNRSVFVDYERNPNTTTPILTSAISWLPFYEWILILADDTVYARPDLNITVWLNQRRKTSRSDEEFDAIFSGDALSTGSGLMFLRRSSAMKKLLMRVQEAVQASPHPTGYVTEFEAIFQAVKCASGEAEFESDLSQPPLPVDDSDLSAPAEIELDTNISPPPVDESDMSQPMKLTVDVEKVDTATPSLRLLKIPGLLTTFQCVNGTLMPIPSCEHDDCTLFKQFATPDCSEIRKKLWEHLHEKEPGSHVGLTRYPASNTIDGASAMKVLSGVITLKRLKKAGIGGVEKFALKLAPVKTRSKIAILCASSGNVEDITLRSMVLSSAWNKEKYAQRHGYDLIMEDADGAGIPDRTGHWVKFGALAKWLPHYEWIYWVDVDSVVMNFTVTLESIIEHANKVSGDNPSFIVAPDSRFLNTGSFLIRNTPKTMEFLDETYNTPQSSWQHWEQGAIIYAVQGDKKLSGKYGVKAGFTTIINASVFNSFPSNWFVPGTTWAPGDFLLHFPAFSGCVMLDGNRITYYLAAVDKSHRMNNVERWPSGLQNWYDNSSGIRRKPFSGV